MPNETNSGFRKTSLVGINAVMQLSDDVDMPRDISPAWFSPIPVSFIQLPTQCPSQMSQIHLKLHMSKTELQIFLSNPAPPADYPTSNATPSFQLSRKKPLSCPCSFITSPSPFNQLSSPLVPPSSSPSLLPGRYGNLPGKTQHIEGMVAMQS